MKAGMNSDGMYLDAIVNGIHLVQPLADTGCLTNAMVSEQFARKSGMTLLDIEPRALRQVVEEHVRPPIISQVAKFRMDIYGYCAPMWAYVLPGQEEEMILGRVWMDTYDALLEPARRRILIRKWRLEVPVFGRKRPHRGTAQRAAAARLLPEVNTQGVVACRVTLEDVQKALHKQKVLETLPQIEKQLPVELQDLATAFDQKSSRKLPPHRPGVDHEINIRKAPDGSELPIPSSPLYHRSKEELLIMRKTILDLLEQGFIRPSRSSAGAPVLFVRKAEGGLRFCVDYRKLNAVTEPDTYPLPLMLETLRTVAQHQWVSKVDVISAFHRVRVRSGDEAKTAFNTRLGSYEWLVTPFGLTGAPATFQRYINWVLRDHLDKDASAFIDDVSIYTNGTREEHFQVVRSVVSKLRAAGLQMDVKKSSFAEKEVKFLGYIVKPGVGLAMDPAKVKAIKEWVAPSTARGVRRFLGFTGFYREFIKDYALIVSPLTGLTRKNHVFDWGRACEVAFQRLKDAALSAPVLAAWVPGLPTKVEADSSGYVTGAALLQQGADQVWHPVAYLSKKLAPAECNYPIHDKEMLAVILALREWRSELLCQPFTVLTDHRNLVYFTTKQQLSERQMRWMGELLAFDCRLVHRPGTEQVLSDALSRREQDMPSGTDDDRLAARNLQMLGERNGVLIVTPEVRSAVASLEAEEDDALRAAAAWVSGADEDKPGDATPAEQTDLPSPFESAELSSLWKAGLRGNRRYWLLREAVREKARTAPSGWGLQISLSECDIDESGRLRWRGRTWIPASEPLRTKLIQVIHDSPLGGHPGREITRDILAREFCWPSLTADVRRFVRNCGICAQTKTWRDKKHGLLKPLPVPSRPWAELSVDFVTGLPPSKGAEAIMVVTDRLSKSVTFEPMINTTAPAVAEALLRCVIRYHGPPRSIVSDRGPQFISAF